ncbi:universal stress protein [Rubrobacter tropicus]|uniref:Universal stress protein n=1 Tax=Rubrobacter tropicus TaxID=2653851 RepID=A0A6G8QE77_9ACTN|nr:universal stress protein [Rubrobacter tropicus]QIN84753.1 universal stress protein [Rubrobacter tropicus]
MDRQEKVIAETAGASVPYRRILVGTDGSGCSERAAAHAVYLAGELGARLYAVNSVNVERAFSAGIHFGEAVAELEKNGREATAAVKAMADSAGVECEEILTTGRPHRAIIQVCDEVDADLVVIGSTGMTSLERALIGSESESLARYSKRPVLIVHQPG